MGKKKKHKRKDVFDCRKVGRSIDHDLYESYAGIRKDVDDYQYEKMMSKRKALKKYAKKMKKGKAYKHYEETYDISKAFEDLTEDFGDLKPIIRLGGRIVATGVIALMAMTPVKKKASKKQIAILDKLFKIGMKL